MKKILAMLSYAALALTSCKPEVIKDPQESMRYMADKRNGLVKEATIAGIKMKVKYLPASYLAYNIAKNELTVSAGKRDSLVMRYANSLTFLVNIGPGEGEHFDITRLGVKDYEGFVQRVNDLVFESKEWMKLENAGEIYDASLVKMEDLNSLQPGRDFIVVFDKREWKGEELCFHYKDEIYNVGQNKFIFKTGDINDVPEFKF